MLTATAPVWRLDHLVIAAAELDPASARIEALLGMPPNGAGRHPTMGTWNRLWGLGGSYLEVIAIDPEAPSPGRPRWFGLDDPGMQALLAGGPRLVAWVAEPPGLETAAAALPVSPGRPETHRRDDLSWTLTIPDDGLPPAGGAVPMLIRWPEGIASPGRSLQARGLSLAALEISMPDTAPLSALPLPAGLALRSGVPGLAATLRLPDGRPVQLPAC